LCLIWTLS